MFTLWLYDCESFNTEIEVYHDSEGGITDIMVDGKQPNDKESVLINANMRKIQSEAVYRAQYPD